MIFFLYLLSIHLECIHASSFRSVNYAGTSSYRSLFSGSTLTPVLNYFSKLSRKLSTVREWKRLKTSKIHPSPQASVRTPDDPAEVQLTPAIDEEELNTQFSDLPLDSIRHIMTHLHYSDAKALAEAIHFEKLDALRFHDARLESHRFRYQKLRDIFQDDSRIKSDEITADALALINNPTVDKALLLHDADHLGYDAITLYLLKTFSFEEHSLLELIVNSHFRRNFRIQNSAFVALRREPDLDKRQLFEYAARFDDLPCIESLLEDSDFNTNPAILTTLKSAFMSAIMFDSIHVVKRLLLDTRIEAAPVDQQPLMEALDLCYFSIALVLLENKRVDPSVRNNYAIIRASEMNHLETVNTLLMDSRVDPSDRQNMAIRKAAIRGHVDVVERLLADERVANALDETVLIDASQNGRADVLERLLQYEKLNPSFLDNFALKVAVFDGHTAVVKLLLADSRMDFSRGVDEFFDYAVAVGNLEMVRIFLANDHFDPSSGHNFALVQAIMKNDFRIVDELLSHPRVYSSLKFLPAEHMIAKIMQDPLFLSNLSSSTKRRFELLFNGK